MLNLIQRLRMTNKVRAEWYRSLEALSRDQIPIVTTLNEMQTEFAEVGHPMYPVVKEVLLRIRGSSSTARDAAIQGKIQTLGVALNGLVPSIEALLIEAGDSTGDPALGLQRAAEHVETTSRLMSGIKGQMIAPAFMLLFLLGVLVFFSIWVLPTYMEISPRSRWPSYALRFAFLADHAIPVAIGVFGGGSLLVLGYLKLATFWIGPFRDWLDTHVWPFTATAQINSAAMLVSLSGFVQAGLPFSSAIEQLGRASQPFMLDVYRRIQIQLRNGRRPDEALAASHLIDRRFKWVLKIYGKTSDFTPALISLSRQFSDFALTRTTFVFFILGFIVKLMIIGFIAWIMATMYGIVQSVRGT